MQLRIYGMGKIWMAVFFITCLMALNITSKAQAARTWISAVGDDVNPCSRTAPCRTLQGAYSKTGANGEIDAIDAGTYGALTITKSITINFTNVNGSVLSSGINGISINIAATDQVRLIGIQMQGGSSGTATGIMSDGSGQVIVENCKINGYFTGINMGGINAHLTLNNTTITGGLLTTATGIRLSGSGISATANDITLEGLDVGMRVQLGNTATLKNSYISRNSTNGLLTEDLSQVNAESVLFVNNGTGITADGTSTVRMSNLGIFNNTTGIARIGTASTLASYSNNKMAGNTTQGNPTAYLSAQ